MAGVPSVKVGDRFWLNYARREVEVIEYINSGKVLIQDEFGNTKWTVAQSLRKGQVAIGDSAIERHREQFLSENHFPHKLKCGLFVDLIRYDGSCKILIGDKFGNQKYVSANQIRDNSILWTEFGYKGTHIDLVGMRIESKRWGWFVVKDQDVFTRKTTVFWEDSGTTQNGYDLYDTHSGAITDKVALEDSHWNYLNVPKGMSYVYVVEHNDEILYIGKGKGSRYLHARNGTSHVLELNRLYFMGEEVKVSIHSLYKTGTEAESAEALLIKEAKPKYNTQHIGYRQHWRQPKRKRQN